MRRLSLLGLGIITVFAMSAAMVASASAALPQFEVKGKKGLEPLKKAVTFTGKGGVGLLKSGGPTIECKESASKGSLTGPKSVTKVQITYRGCAIPTLGVTCQTAKKAGEIKTEKVKATLVYAEAPKVGATAGALFEPEGATSFAKFKCATIEVVVTGSVIGEATPTNVLQTTGKIVLEESGESEKEKCGKQKWQFAEGIGACHHLEALGGPSWIVTSEDLTFKSAVQVTA